MRIVAGRARGLKLKTIEEYSTRPTKDMVKEALFSIIMDYIPDSIVLDLFAGSGGIGIEAISRGAQKCYFIDSNKACIDVIKENLTKAKFLEDSEVLYSDFDKALDKLKDTKFDIIYIDPPYNQGLGLKAINKISSYDMLNSIGVLVFETDSIEDVPEVIGKYEKFKEKKYGRNVLSFFLRKE